MRSMKVALLLVTAQIGMLLPTVYAQTRHKPKPRDSKTLSSNVFRVSLSVSPFTDLLMSKGIVFTDGKQAARTPEELQQMFMKYGANEVYARIATNRKHTVGFGDHSLDHGLERARMARDLNLPFNPELGLFNVYGDVRCQPPPNFHDYPEIKVPGPWTSLTLSQMLPILRSYGTIVARMILATGVKVRIWDLGNEVDFGTAGVAVQPFPKGCDDSEGGPGWYRPPNNVDPAIGKMSVIGLMKMPTPDRIAWLQKHLWPYEAQMLAAVAAGIRSVDPTAKFSTHVSGITAILPAQAVAFFKAMKKGGYFPDELGFSFYPSSSDHPPNRLQAFERTMETVHAQLGRPFFIAEFGYPSTTPRIGAFSTWDHPVPGYPLTTEGQADLLRDLVSWGLGAGLAGIRPWAPEAVVPGWGPFALFKMEGKTAVAKPALGAIEEALHSR